VATAPAPVAVIDPLTAEQLGVTNGQLIDVCGPISLRVPVKIDTTMTAEAVWIPSLRGDSTAPQSRTTVPDAPGTVVSLSAVETETSREAGVA
ncbi:NADH-quinone oxidoreductase subunit G, partial [Muribacter muris]|nr:NADH-quinone oxidoreductase subunit G [Muribacter muris]